MRGATYADARVMDIRLRDLSTKNGQVGTLAESESCGIGIRVIARGSWGFASTDRLTREGIAACAATPASTLIPRLPENLNGIDRAIHAISTNVIRTPIMSICLLSYSSSLVAGDSRAAWPGRDQATFRNRMTAFFAASNADLNTPTESKY